MFARRYSLFVLRDNQGRVLLQHRPRESKDLPNYWAFFGGKIEKNETPEEALVREAKEELGIKLDNFTIFKTYEFEESKELYQKVFFTAPLLSSLEELKKNQKEGQHLGLFSFEELKNLKISKNDRTVLKDIFKKA